MKRLASILLWSIVSAAFIGPGTVAAAAAAGAGYGLDLLWALAFSTLACLVLQEASARVTIASGYSLGQALRRRYPRGLAGAAVVVLVFGAVVVGCAAYEAGNILGGVSGALLALPVPPHAMTVGMVAAAGLLLWFNSPRRVAMLLSLLVAVMGLAFLWCAARIAPPVGGVVVGALTPAFPAGSALLTLALVGTTVVPYNLFLGAGLASGQRLSEMRLGLVVAVVLGGMISMAVLVVGTATRPPLEFADLAEILASRLGSWSRNLFAAGLFAAGLSSAVTAPLAAAMTARSLFSRLVADAEQAAGHRWDDRSWRFRGVWSMVLAVGLAFGLSGVRPVPMILAAQALNGVLLPVVAVFLLVVVNDRELVGAAANGLLSNLLLVAVTGVAALLGATNLATAGARAVGADAPGIGLMLALTFVGGLLVGGARLLGARRRGGRR